MQRAAVPTRPRGGVRWTPLALGGLLLLASVVAATAVGSVTVAPADILGAIGRGLGGRLEGPQDTIVWMIRLPRVLLAGLVGAALSLAGVGYQGVFRNPLADPYLLGVASGGAFGASLAILYGASVPLLAWLGVPGVAFAFALLTVSLVLLLARQEGRLPTLSMILAGVVVGSSLSAATSFVMLGAREQAAGILAWMLGSFAFASWGKIATVLPFVLVATSALILAARALNLLQLGEEQAMQLGLPLEAFRIGVVTVATLATAAAVSVAGVIGFVGLVVPHAGRLALGPDHRTLVPLAALVGASFLILADLLARSVIAPAELPIGVVTALVGGPFFLYLLRRRPARA